MRGKHNNNHAVRLPHEAPDVQSPNGGTVPCLGTGLSTPLQAVPVRASPLLFFKLSGKSRFTLY